MNLDCSRFLRRLATDTPLMDEGALSSFFNAYLCLLQPQAAEHPYFKQLKEKLRPQATVQDGVAVIQMYGPMFHRPDAWELLMGAEDSDYLLTLVRSTAARDDVSAIVLDIDSPGGMALGTPELADAVSEADAKKPVVAFTSGLMASAAYWVGSQARAIIASRSAQVGSIGVYIAYLDLAGYYAQLGAKMEVITNSEGTLKGIGIPGTSLSDAHRAHLRDRAQANFDEFRATVQARRPAVTADAMKGQTFSGAKARQSALIDDVGSLSDALALARWHARK